MDFDACFVNSQGFLCDRTMMKKKISIWFEYLLIN